MRDVKCMISEVVSKVDTQEDIYINNLVLKFDASIDLCSFNVQLLSI